MSKGVEKLSRTSDNTKKKSLKKGRPSLKLVGPPRARLSLCAGVYEKHKTKHNLGLFLFFANSLDFLPRCGT